MLNWNMKSWTVTSVIMWLLCEHGVEASKGWVFVAHFIHSFNTTMPIPCRDDIHSGDPMSHVLNRRVGMSSQALNFRSRANYIFKMSRMQARLQNVEPCTTNFSPSLVENLPRLGQQCHVISRYLEIYWNISECNTINYNTRKKKYLIVVIGNICLLTTNMCAHNELRKRIMCVRNESTKHLYKRIYICVCVFLLVRF